MTGYPGQETPEQVVRRRITDLVVGMVADRSDDGSVHPLVRAATEGDEQAWNRLAEPPDTWGATLAEIMVTGTLQPFPRAEDNPFTGFTGRVRDVLTEALRDEDDTDRLRRLATAAIDADADEGDAWAELLAVFARTPEELSQLGPVVDEQLAGGDVTWVTLTTTTTTLTTTTTTTTLACTGTTTATTTTTLGTTTTTSHLCTHHAVAEEVR